MICPTDLIKKSSFQTEPFIDACNVAEALLDLFFRVQGRDGVRARVGDQVRDAQIWNLGQIRIALVFVLSAGEEVGAL